MGKCNACTGGKCEGKSENRNYCEDPDNCTCICNETDTGVAGKICGALLGAAAFGTGVFITVSTGGVGALGIAAIFGGGALTGAGASAAIHPISKTIAGERISSEYINDIAIGSVTGLLTGPLSFAGAGITNCVAKAGEEVVRQGITKFGCRMVVGGVTGTVASVVEGVGNDTFSVKSVVQGGIVGAITGGVGHGTGNIVTRSEVTGVAKSITKVSLDVIGSGVVDVGTQMVTNGEVDLNQVAFNAGTTAATSAGFEAAKNGTYKCHGGKDQLIEKIKSRAPERFRNNEDEIDFNNLLDYDLYIPDYKEEEEEKEEDKKKK